MNRLIHLQCRGLGKISAATSCLTSKLRLALFVAAALIILQGAEVQADFAGLSGLTVTGGVTFDTPSLWIDGAPTISGNFSKTVGGSTDSSGFDRNGVLTGDPVSQAATLTHSGDGFSMAASVSGFETSEIDVLGLDLIINLSNSSTVSHLVTIGLNFSNAVDADGIDAYADSSLTLDDPADEIFFTDLTSDTLYGDVRNDNDLGTFGNIVSHSGTRSWDITLDPGQSIALIGAFSMSAGAFPTVSSFAGEFNAQFTVVPEPSTILLLGIGCLPLIRRKNRTK